MAKEEVRGPFSLNGEGTEGDQDMIQNPAMIHPQDGMRYRGEARGHDGHQVTSNPAHLLTSPLTPQLAANTPSIVRLNSSNRTAHPSTTVVKDHHIRNSIRNSQPLASTSLVPMDPLSINSKLNHKTNPSEERLRKRIKKAKQAVRKRRPRWLKVTMQNFSTFCNQTSLHGWQYIAQSHTSSLKHVFWALIVSLSMATAAIFLYNNTMDYLHATVVTTVDTMTVPLTEVFFPSVVVCNINQVRKSFFEELGIYDNDTFIKQIYFDYIEGKKDSHKSSNSFDPSNDGHINGTFENAEKKIAIHTKIMEEYLKKINSSHETEQSINWVTHQKCHDMFILSKWNATTSYNFEIPREFGTDYGICCWYTPQLNFTEILEHQMEHNLTEPDWSNFFLNIKKGAKTGKDNGYTMLFDIESFDYSYYDEGSEGLKVALVHHLDMPIMRQTGFHIAPGTENQIAVTPTLISTSKNAMERFTPEERDCYSEEEISLKYLPRDHGYRYEMSNCLFESAFENILRECKCVPGFHQMGGEEALERYNICIGSNLTCMNVIMNQMGQFDHVDHHGEQMKCRSNCEDQINSLFVTTSSYPNRKTLFYREEFCIVAQRLLQKCEGPKRKPLEHEYPNICTKLSPLTRMRSEVFCKDNIWSLPRNLVDNCTRKKCPLEEAILDYARDNLVMFNIFIKDPYAKRFQKDEKITKTSYIANSGGLLGLCMGFSLISAAEILFHCFFGIFSAICPKRCGPIRKEKQYQRKESLLLYTPSRRRHSRYTGCYVQECEEHNGYNNDKQVNHTTENHAKDQIESEDTHVYNNRGIYNEYEEHYCLLHHYPNCHYHQHGNIANQKTTYDNQKKHLNSNLEYTEDVHEPCEGNSSQIHYNEQNHSVYTDNSNKVANKLKVSKPKTGKSKRLILSSSGENIVREGNDMCAHCQSPITSAYTGQSIEPNDTMVAKDASQLYETNRDLVNDGDKRVNQTIASEKKNGNYSSTVALEQSGSETNTESPFKVMLMLDNQVNSGGKLSSGDTGYNDDEDEDECTSNTMKPVDPISQDGKNNEEDENPHLHLHLLTHPDQQAMHIRCSDKVCSTCANAAPIGSAEILLQTARYSFSDMDSPSLRDEIDPGECKIHGITGKINNVTYNSQNKCFVHGTKNADEEARNYTITPTSLPDSNIVSGSNDNHLHENEFYSSRIPVSHQQDFGKSDTYVSVPQQYRQKKTIPVTSAKPCPKKHHSSTKHSTSQKYYAQAPNKHPKGRRKKIASVSSTSNAVCEHKQQQQMTDLGETTSFSQSTQPKTPSEELLPLTNHIHELDNEMNRSDTKSNECNRHSTSSRELINHLPSGNSGALTQGNNVIMI